MPKAVPPPMTAAPTATAVMSAAGLRMRRRLPPCAAGRPSGPVPGPSPGNVAYGGTTGGGGTGAPGAPEAAVGNVAVSDTGLPDAGLPVAALPNAGVSGPNAGVSWPGAGVPWLGAGTPWPGMPVPLVLSLVLSMTPRVAPQNERALRRR